MKTLVYAFLSVVLFAGLSFAQDKGKGGGEIHGAPQIHSAPEIHSASPARDVEKSKSVEKSVQVQKDVQVQKGVNVQTPRADVQVNRGDARPRVDINTPGVHVDVDRVRIGNDHDRLGDRDFDHNGIGVIVRPNYATGNDWRYRTLHGERWYFTPQNTWMYYRSGAWVNYDINTYSIPTYAAPLNFNGPYYEDSQGFFSIHSGIKIYDEHIQRVQ